MWSRYRRGQRVEPPKNECKSEINATFEDDHPDDPQEGQVDRKTIVKTPATSRIFRMANGAGASKVRYSILRRLLGSPQLQTKAL